MQLRLADAFVTNIHEYVLFSTSAYIFGHVSEMARQQGLIMYIFDLVFRITQPYCFLFAFHFLGKSSFVVFDFRLLS